MYPDVREVDAAPDEHDELRRVTAAELERLTLAHPGYADLLAGWLRGT